MILKIAGFQISFFSALRLTWIGMFFSLALPGAVSGDLYKGYYLVKEQENKSLKKPVLTLLADRIIGLFSLILSSFIGIFLNMDLILEQTLMHFLAGSIILVFFSGVILWGGTIFLGGKAAELIFKVLFFLPKSKSFHQLLQITEVFKKHRLTWLGMVLLSMASHLVMIFIFLQIIHLLQMQAVDWSLLLLIIPLGMITTAIPIAPAGIGIGHIAFENLFMLTQGIKGGADLFNLYVATQILFSLLGMIPLFWVRKNNFPTGLPYRKFKISFFFFNKLR